ncbi:MAG TPA: hypothetical protein DCP69_00795 [Candidatus Omnitrophica bacterium]|nr:hypothetical protein [Candidatus Omnitrophota bacterium]
MGLIADTLRIGNRAPAFVQSQGGWGSAPPQTSYLNFARAYATNEIVFAAIELLASSAGEPHISGRRWRRNKATIRSLYADYMSKGLTRPNARLVENGFVEELDNHPLVRLLNAPNPFMSRGQMWGTVVMDRCLAGNSYLYKARVQNGPLKGTVAELWRLRPDRVRAIPDPAKFISGYEYNLGTEKIIYPASDIIHFRTRNPLNDYYGMPPLMAISGRIDIDGYMKDFLKGFFENGGTGPGAILTVKGTLSAATREKIDAEHDQRFGNPSRPGKLMILDNTESTYQQMGLNRGLRDALPKELNAMQESRIAMAFGIPGSILGLLIGYESSSYANKRADWQVLWDVTMAPMLSDLDDVLNLSLIPDFGGIDEVYFDLDDIKALQEDVDKIQKRERENFQAGAISLEEFRDAIGRDPDIKEGTFFVPSNIQPVEFDDLCSEPEPMPMPAEESEVEMPMKEEMAASLSWASMPDSVNTIVAVPRCPTCSRGIGRNIQAGGELWCRNCKSEFVVRPSPSLDNLNR